MKVLLVAPKLCSPWSEGRKKFVLDLIHASRDCWDLSLLCTVDSGESPPPLDIPLKAVHVGQSHEHLSKLFRELPDYLKEQHPDLVLHFPFGAFSGVRSIANLAFILWLRWLCRRRRLAEMTLMYSVTSEANNRLHEMVLRGTYRNQYSGQGRSIRFGVSLPGDDCRNFVDDRSGFPKKKLLFLAGMAEVSAERLDYVLQIRGLAALLDAGPTLVAQGFELCVGIPFLKDPSLLQEIRRLAGGWGEAITYKSLVECPDIYRENDIFVFPYAREELQFVPTSVVESMHWGTPVVMPKLQFLEPFWRTGSVVQGYEPGATNALVSALQELSENGGRYQEMTDRAREFVDSEYGIDATVKDIEAQYQLLKS